MTTEKKAEQLNAIHWAQRLLFLDVYTVAKKRIKMLQRASVCNGKENGLSVLHLGDAKLIFNLPFFFSSFLTFGDT